MRTAVLLLLAAAARADATVEIEARDACFVHEPVRVRLRVRLDGPLLEGRGVQMFHTELDVPVQVEAPWLAGVDGAVVREDAEGRPGFTLALGDEVVRAARPEPGVLEIERTFLPRRPGALVLDAPRVRYMVTTGFEEDMFGRRVPKDRRDVVVEGEPHAITVRALPEAPPGFTGAVGRFRTRATASKTRVAVDESFELVFRIEGEGNLDLFDTPRLDLEGFHVYGTLDDRARGRRTITYDLAPIGDVDEVPAIPFVHFDPAAATYRTARTEPIPLDVEGGASPASKERGGFPTLPVAATVLAVTALAVWLGRRGRGAVADSAAAFDESEDLEVAFIGFLAARLACPPASVISPDLRERLEAADVPADLAARAAALMERLVAARYGGETPDEHARAEARVLAEKISAR